MYETRYIKASELRAETNDKGQPVITGYAAVFNSLSEDLGGFRETIKPGAFANALKNADVRALINHDEDKVLGRTTSGTLELREDDKGLRATIYPPNTSYANDLMQVMGRDDVNQMSFGFRVNDKGQSWDFSNGKNIRTISDFTDIFDVSVVTFPAYKDTSVEVALRSMAQAKEQEKENYNLLRYGLKK